jgi:hypothetical protein
MGTLKHSLHSFYFGFHHQTAVWTRRSVFSLNLGAVCDLRGSLRPAKLCDALAAGLDLLPSYFLQSPTPCTSFTCASGQPSDVTAFAFRGLSLPEPLPDVPLTR